MQLPTSTPAEHSTLHAATEDRLSQTAQFILSQQLSCGAIPWYQGGKLDPWDHVEAAMALATLGHFTQAEAAYAWLAQNQLPDGSWQAHYFCEQTSALRETNFVAYVATGVWHHFLVTDNRAFLTRMYPTVKRAIDFVVHRQNPEGDIAWAVDAEGVTQNDALVTACASILRSLECAIACARALDQNYDHWLHSAHALKQALLYKPFRFDRTWPSKQRFAMDWYYPILAGIYSQDEAQLRLNKRWNEFVQPQLGCRCVNDEPWVTMAETSELVIALIASGQQREALKLFQTLDQWRTENGAYWTGYVYRDKTLWPDETTTWTAGAVILAADALFKISRAHNLFITPLAI